MSEERIVDLTSCDDVLKHWNFLLEGLAELNTTVKDSPVTTEAFLRVHLDVAVGKLYGRTFLLTSKNGKPLGFATAYENSSEYRPTRSLWLYAVYSNRKNLETPKLLFGELEKWARSFGFQEIQSQSGRTSGAAIRWARAQFGMQLSKLFFTKAL